MIDQLLSDGQALRDQVPSLLTLTSPEVIDEEIIKRKMFRIRCKQEMDAKRDQMDKLRAEIRVMDNERDWQMTDIDQLSAAKWELIRSRPKL